MTSFNECLSNNNTYEAIISSLCAELSNVRHLDEAYFIERLTAFKELYGVTVTTKFLRGYLTGDKSHRTRKIKAMLNKCNLMTVSRRNYPKHKGAFIRVLTYEDETATGDAKTKTAYELADNKSYLRVILLPHEAKQEQQRQEQLKAWASSIWQN